MEAPQYTPQTWVRATQGNGQIIGKIVGASGTPDRGWLYYVTNAAANSNYTVPEANIIEEIDTTPMSEHIRNRG